jgi:hypothetical protein
LLTGCVATEEYTLYLQDVGINGPISQPPLHITNRKRERPLSVTPHIAINATSSRSVAGQIEGHSLVGASGTYEVDTIFSSNHRVSFRERSNANAFTGQNLHWKLPEAVFGVDVDYATSNHLAISLGANYSAVDGIDLWGYRVGLGLFSEDSTAAVRLDAGLGWQTLAYEARTVVVKRTTYVFSSDVDEEVGFFRDKGTSTPMDLYASLTFNTKSRGWFPSVFVQLAVSRQSLASFKPTIQESFPLIPVFQGFTPEVIVQDTRGKFSSTVFVITPGIYFDISPSARLLAGVHINVQTEITDSSPSTIVLPLLECEWSL